MIQDIYLGFIKVHVLYRASKDPVYGVWMMKELERRGYAVSPGIVYPLLNSMEKQGYLSRYKRVIHGRTRKYYKMTEKGENILESTKKDKGAV